MKCVCGNENPNEAKFCNECGKPIMVEKEIKLSSENEVEDEKGNINDENIKTQSLSKYSVLLFLGVGILFIASFLVLYILPCQNLKVQAEKAYDENKFKDAKFFFLVLDAKDHLDIYSKYDDQSDLDKQIYYQEAYELAKHEIENEGNLGVAISKIDCITEDYILFNDSSILAKQLEEIVLKDIEKISLKIKDLNAAKLSQKIIMLSNVNEAKFMADMTKEKADSLKIKLFDRLGELGLEKCKNKKYDEAAVIFEIFIEENQVEHEAYKKYSSIMEKKLAADIEIKNKEEEKRLAKEKAEAEKAAKELVKKKKSEGVNIGMTQEDVLASSWGKPNDINRTITDYGTREQWCYGNGNYLYFNDGILSSIQN